MKRCTRCLYPDTKPDLHFDEVGLCSACRAHDGREDIDWAAREGELMAILATGKNGSGYDCIVPSSGGKDSHWQVLKLIELGVRPLVVTAATCHLTPIGRANIDNLALYATTIEVTPNRAVRATLNRIGLEVVGDISWPEHVSIFTTPFRVACDLGIPLIFYGECPQNQYGGPPGATETREMTLRWVQEFGGFLGLRPADMIGQRGITEADMAEYQPPLAERVKTVGVRAYFLGQFYAWDSHRNAEVAIEHGMQVRLPSPANWWEAENLDNAQTGLHDYLMFTKYGYGRATAQLSVDIRDRRTTRERALAVANSRDGLFPATYAGVWARDALAPLGLTVDQFKDIAARFGVKKAA